MEHDEESDPARWRLFNKTKYVSGVYESLQMADVMKGA